ncbi:MULTISPECIES: hypothetical protein [unclassified Clostridium]|uniref:hypothetical protein n=1 Tax=unclassified Clostridium TaxID=2614128 RepID=UPI0025BA8395|nr:MULTISPECIES: hypothetical protein [unclassified Clostridium]
MEELRKVTNKIEAIGVVKEHKLEEGKGDKGKYINGSLTVKTGENSEIPIKVFVQQNTKEGKERKVFTTLKQFIDGSLHTMATDKENAAILHIYGNKDFTPQIKEEIFVPANEEKAITKISLDLGFGNIKVDNSLSEEDFKAAFDIEMFVTDITEELKGEEPDEEETGRVIVKGLVPNYDGTVFPLEVVAGKIVDEEGEEYDFAEDIKENVSEGDTLNIWGDINYQSIIEKVKKGGSLGRAKIEEKRTYINELVATGAEVVEDDDKQLDEELIEKASKERASKIKEKENEAKDDKKENKKGLTNKKDNKERKPKKSLGF